MRRALLTTTLLLSCAAMVPWAQAQEAPGARARLQKAVTPQGILAHLQQLQSIANRYDGTRASGTRGYDASVAYVASNLRRAGYRVTQQNFVFPYFQELADATFSRISPAPRNFRLDVDFASMQYSGSAPNGIRGQLVPTNDVQIPPSTTGNSTSGCELSDFTPAPAPTAVALIQRGTCDFIDKVQNASAAGYGAVIIFNEGQPGRQELLIGDLGTPSDVPTIGTTYAVGLQLYQQARAGQVQVNVSTRTFSENRVTTNVIADSATGRNDRVVVVGAHLDSELAGPGMNDNGSGSAVTLEVALQIAKLGLKPDNKLRFAFWGAEELGLLGSYHYVETLTREQRRNIDLNLNFDMLGSPNYARFVYDGDGSEDPEAGPGPEGSDTIEEAFLDHFKAKRLATQPTAFDGRSDYGPFIEVGIAAGGLFSGAEEIKTAAQQRLFGGRAGTPFDVCYHQACDDYDNVSSKAIDEMSDAAAAVTWKFATYQNAVAIMRAGVKQEATEDSAQDADNRLARSFEYKGSRLIR